MIRDVARLCCRGFVRVRLFPILYAVIGSCAFGRLGIGKRLRIGSGADIGTRPGEVVGTPARCNDGFAAIEHACGERVGFSFSWLTGGAQKLAAFFHVGRI